MRTSSSLSLAVIGLAVPGALLAQSLPPTQAPSPDVAGAAAATAVEAVVVTPNRSPTPIDQVGQSVTLLTLPQIRADQETTIADLIARTPGVTFSRSGGPGEVTSIFIRGAESDQTLVLIDGVRANDPSDPGVGFDFSTLLTGDVARIEVLRGPQSTLYGSEAIGGVVNVVTQEPTRPLQGELQAEGGTYGTAYARAAIGGKEDRFSWRLAAYSDSTDGIPTFDRYLGGREDRGFHTQGESGRLLVDITPAVQFDERFYYVHARNEFDGFDTPTGNFGDDLEFGRSQQFIDYSGFNITTLDGRLKNRVAFEYNDISRVNEDPQQIGTKYTFLDTGQTSTFEYEGTYALARHWNVVFGAQAEHSIIDTVSPPFNPVTLHADQDIDGGYAQLTGEPVSGLTLTGGVRVDAHTTFGPHATGQASAAWRLNDGNTILRASFGQGYKAPSLYQLYSEYGNVSLRPETATGWDTGIEQHFLDSHVILQATWFGLASTDLIEFVECVGVATPECLAHQIAGGYYDNVDKALSRGVELQAEVKPTAALDLTANYTFDDAEDRSPGSPTYGDQLARRPRNLANLQASYVWPCKLTTTVAVRHASHSYDDAPNTILLKGYYLLDLRASYPLRHNVELYARVENATNTRYETVFEYGTLGRAAYAGVRFDF